MPKQIHEHEGDRSARLSGCFSNQAGTRDYELYGPTGNAPSRRPLLVMLHGCLQAPNEFAAATRMDRHAAARRWFVLYPAQSRAANASLCWNWLQAGHQRRDAGELAILAGMTEDVLRRRPIDPERVYVAGLSAGGAMAALLAAAYPELYAAVCIHSAPLYPLMHHGGAVLEAMRWPSASIGVMASRTPRPPMIAWCGDRDATVAPISAAQVFAWVGAARGVGGPPRPEPSDRVSVEHGRVAGGYAYAQTRHCDRDGALDGEHWLIHGAGHGWSGGDAAVPYTEPRGPDASAEMLRFFDECRRY